MSYRVEVLEWVNGSGFSYNETFDVIDTPCSAEEYIESLDDRFDYAENEDILVKIINNDDDEEYSEAWVSNVYEAQEEDLS